MPRSKKTPTIRVKETYYRSKIDLDQRVCIAVRPWCVCVRVCLCVCVCVCVCVCWCRYNTHKHTHTHTRVYIYNNITPTHPPTHTPTHTHTHIHTQRHTHTHMGRGDLWPGSNISAVVVCSQRTSSKAPKLLGSDARPRRPPRVHARWPRPQTVPRHGSPSTRVEGRVAKRTASQNAPPAISAQGGERIGVCLLLQYPLQSCSRGRGGNNGGHVLRVTTSRGLCGLVCPSRISERGGEGYLHAEYGTKRVTSSRRGPYQSHF
jgi:hypothetical protein